MRSGWPRPATRRAREPGAGLGRGFAEALFPPWFEVAAGGAVVSAARSAAAGCSRRHAGGPPHGLTGPRPAFLTTVPGGRAVVLRSGARVRGRVGDEPQRRPPVDSHLEPRDRVAPRLERLGRLLRAPRGGLGLGPR